VVGRGRDSAGRQGKLSRYPHLTCADYPNTPVPLTQGPLVRCAPYLLVVTPPVGVLRSNQAPGTHANLNTEQWEYLSLQFATIRRPSTVTFGYPHGSSLQAPRLGSSKPSFYIL
jgi:hypothetical protein